MELQRIAAMVEKGSVLAELRRHEAPAESTQNDLRGLKRFDRRGLVNCSPLLNIGAAWLITVPGPGALAAILYFTNRGMILP